MTYMLRFLACGSVDDGKSTLIGRLLYDTEALREDQLTALELNPDFSLLLGGLIGKQEQSITIEVAYRQFSSNKRRFMIADALGHE